VTTNNYGTAFFVGIAFGYLFRKKILFTKIQEILFWILSTLMMTGVLLWHNTFFRLDKSAPLLSVLLWHSIGKLLFCLGFAWILYACCIGRGGLYLFFAFKKKLVSKNSIKNFFSQIINNFFRIFFRKGFLNRFLSWHGFQPLARLSFGIYLLHSLVVFHRIYTIKEVYVMTDSLMVNKLSINSKKSSKL
jgi:peptidoglycan/LPS O-acetylase OafA/YrhL